MAVVHGKDGSVKLTAGNTLLSVSSWKANIGAEIHDVTSLGDTWAKRATGVKEVTGTFTCFFDPADTNGQNAVRTAALGGTILTDLRLYTGANYYAGNAYVTMSASATQGDVTTVDFNFSSDGTWSYT